MFPSMSNVEQSWSRTTIPLYIISLPLKS